MPPGRVDNRLVEVHLRPVGGIGPRGQMRGGDDAQDAAGAGERPFGGRLGSGKARPQVAAPDIRVGIGIVEQAAGDAVGVLVFLPIPTRA